MAATTDPQPVLAKGRLNAVKTRTSLRLCAARLQLLKNKKRTQGDNLRREISELLRAGKEESARIRVEAVIRERMIIETFEMLELYCELLAVRLPILERAKELPLDMRESVGSILFSSQRLETEIPELKVIATQLKNKFGNDYFKLCTSEASAERAGVGPRVVMKLAVVAPAIEYKMEVLAEIAREFHVDWQGVPVAPDLDATEEASQKKATESQETGMQTATLPQYPTVSYPFAPANSIPDAPPGDGAHFSPVLPPVGVVASPSDSGIAQGVPLPIDPPDAATGVPMDHPLVSPAFPSASAAITGGGEGGGEGGEVASSPGVEIFTATVDLPSIPLEPPVPPAVEPLVDLPSAPLDLPTIFPECPCPSRDAIAPAAVVIPPVRSVVAESRDSDDANVEVVAGDAPVSDAAAPEQYKYSTVDEAVRAAHDYAQKAAAAAEAAALLNGNADTLDPRLASLGIGLGLAKTSAEEELVNEEERVCDIMETAIQEAESEAKSGVDDTNVDGEFDELSKKFEALKSRS